MKVLITGGAGFIGGNFVYYALREHPNWQIVCLDKLTYAANPATLKRAKTYPNFTFVQGDIADGALVFPLFEREKFDLVINFAAESHVDRSIKNSRVFLESNVLGVQTLLDACNAFGVGRFHQISTDEVYGDLSLGSTEPAFSENSPLKPSSPYAASKAAADLLVLSYRRTYGTPVTISRSSNNYGPYQFAEKFIPLCITRALSGRRPPLYGDGKNVRDWLYVEDHCRAIDVILSRGREGEIYNVGGGCELPNIEVLGRIMRSLGKDEDFFEYVADRPGHDRRYAMDFSKIKELGWQPQMPFESGLARTIDWYRQNNEWWG